jgi:DNA mismatch repair protein MutS
MSEATKSTTPMMRQWERIKAQHPDTLLLFRMGDFYELFADDAVTAARECDITLTARDKSSNAVPMCGVPYHAAERYIAQLVGKGYRCAICDQVEDPKYARGLVKREVTRVLSPGTLLEDSFLQSVGAARGNNFLAALCADKELTRFGLSLIDISTGEFLAGEVVAEAEVVRSNSKAVVTPVASCEVDDLSTQLNGSLELNGSHDVANPAQSADQTPLAANESQVRWAKVREELLRFAPSELLVPHQLRECAAFWQMLQSLDVRLTAFDAAGLDASRQKLLNHFRTSSLRGYGVEELPLAQDAAALVLDYLKDTHLGSLGHVRRLGVLATGRMDAARQRDAAQP